MKKMEKKINKILDKGFTIGEWKSFPVEIKTDQRIIEHVVKQIETKTMEYIDIICKDNPFLIKYLAEEIQLKLVNNDNFKLLSEDLQRSIISENNNKVRYADKNIQVEYATERPLMFSYLDKKVQMEMIEKNKFYLEYASQDIQIESASKNSDVLWCCSNRVQCMFIKKNPNYYSKCSHEVKRDIIVLANLNPEMISVDTLESYLSCHSDDLSMEELDNYKEKLKLNKREDREEIVGYIEYLQRNIVKKMM